MFRPTHFAILFAVVLCANAFPAAPDAPALDSSLSAAKPSAPGSEAGVVPAKSDLDTDATVHLGYGYYGPRWAGYYGPGSFRAYYGPYSWW